MIDMSWRRLIFPVVGLMTVATSPAYANIGIPMIAVIMPASWILLIPVIFIESAVAESVLGYKYWRAIKPVAVANAVSTIIGIPITWGLLVLVQMFSGGGGSEGLNTFALRIYAVTVQSPWLIPYASNELEWMLPAAGITLCIPFFFASVFCEYLVMNKLISANPTAIKHWAWLANGISYGMIVAILIVQLIIALL